MSGAGYAFGIVLTLAFYGLFIVPMNRSYRKQKLALMRKTIRKRIAYNLVHSKQKLISMDESKIRKQYPIRREVDGWYFRVEKIGNEKYLAEGIDLSGRKLLQKGAKQEHLLIELAAQAKEVIRQLDAHNKLNQAGTH